MKKYKFCSNSKLQKSKIYVQIVLKYAAQIKIKFCVQNSLKNNLI